MKLETLFKKELKEAVAAGRKITVYQPGGIFPGETNGRICIEGPHYPKPHRWYSSGVVKDGVIVSAK